MGHRGDAALDVVEMMLGARQPLTELPDGLGGRYVAVDGSTGRIAVVATSNPTLHSRGDPAAPDDRLVVLDAGGAVLATAALPGPRLVDSVTWMDTAASSSCGVSQPRSSTSSRSTAPCSHPPPN